MTDYSVRYKCQWIGPRGLCTRIGRFALGPRLFFCGQHAKMAERIRKGEMERQMGRQHPISGFTLVDQ